MYCKNCGAQMPDKALFCGKCGVKVEHITETKKYHAKKIAIFLGIFIFILIGCLSLFTADLRVNWKIKSGNKYLTEEKYDDAIKKFDDVLKDDNFNMKAYLGKIYAFKGKNDIMSLGSTYRNAIALIESLDADKKELYSDEIALIYLETDEVYKTNMDKVMSELQTGYSYANSEEVKSKYLQKYEQLIIKLTDSKDCINLLLACDKIIEVDANHEEAINVQKQAAQGAVRILLNQGKIDEAERIIIEKYSQIMDEGTWNQLRKEIDSKSEVIGIKTKMIKDSWFEAIHTVEEYDKTGHLVTSSLYNYYDNQLWGYTKYQYDMFGNIVSEKYYSSDHELTSNIKYEYTYDAAGNIHQKIRKDTTDNNDLITTYEYDSVLGKLLNEKIEDSITEYQYWQNGNLKEITKRYADINGIYEYKEIFEYNEGGIILKHTTYRNDSELVDEAVYNNNGDLALYCSYYEGQLDDRRECFYDEEGTLVRADVLMYGGYTTIWTYEYIYDTNDRLTNENIYWSQNKQTPYLKLWTTYEYWD